MTSSTYWLGGWAGLRAGLDTEARGKNFAYAGDQWAIFGNIINRKI
jgi:hypothetical protein